MIHVDVQSKVSLKRKQQQQQQIISETKKLNMASLPVDSTDCSNTAVTEKMTFISE